MIFSEHRVPFKKKKRKIFKNVFIWLPWVLVAACKIFLAVRGGAQTEVFRERESEVPQSCRTLCNPMDCSPPGYSVHGIFQAGMLEWVAISFSRGSSPPRDRTWVSCFADGFFTNWATREAQNTKSAIKNSPAIITYKNMMSSHKHVAWKNCANETIYATI